MPYTASTLPSRPTPLHHMVVLLLALAASGGCAYPRLQQAPPVTTAFDRPQETGLGQRLEPLARAHSDRSGLYVLGNGLDAFAARIGLIEQAEQSIDLQVYILHDDVTGRIVVGRLLDAAERGARVRLLLDDMGSAGIDGLIAPADAHPNLEVRLFNPFARGPLPGLARGLDLLGRMRKLNHRMHNKLLAVDGAAGIVGGRNVGDEYFDAHEDVNFADLDLLAFGPVVRELGECFDLYWNSPFAVPVSAWASLRRGPDDLARLRAELGEHLEAQKDSRFAERLRGSRLVQEAAQGHLPLVWAPTRAIADLPRKVVARGEDVAETLLTHRIAPLLPEAQAELLVVSPYFVPRGSGVAALTASVERGVRVRVLTNALSATDVPAVHAGYSRYRRDLLAGGVELHELRPRGAGIERSHGSGAFGSSQASLHAKTFVIDRGSIFVGSLNLDPRSVELNTEMGLLVESEELAARLAAGFEELAGPEFSWRLALEPHGGGTRLAWHGEQDGSAVELTVEPDTSWWRRFTVGLLRALPIEGQL